MAEPPTKGNSAAQRLLLVSDDALVRDMLAPPLVAAGYSVTAVSIPSELNDLFTQAAAHDAMILDTDTPAVAASGIMRALKAKKDSLRTPIIGLSKSPTTRATRKAADAGMGSLISKHDRQTLLDTLTYTLDTSAETANEEMELAA
jgi:two-component system chemotaxis sensor kinase CheA